MPVWARVMVLGSGGSVPTLDRGAPAVAVRDWMGYAILLDAGEGVQLQLHRAGLSPLALDVVAITHAHGDHVNGLPGLLQSMYVNDRDRSLVLVAPRSVLDFVYEVLEATESRLGFRVEGVEASGQGSYTVWSRGGDSLRLRWVRSCHTRDSVAFILEWRLRPRLDPDRLRSLGLKPGAWVSRLLSEGSAMVGDRLVRLEELSGQKDSVIKVVYTGDTMPCSTILEASRGADVLIHDSTYHSGRRSEAHDRGHSSSLDAALIARDAGVRLLILAHVSARYSGGEALELLREARMVHPSTVLAWDGMTIEVRRS